MHKIANTLFVAHDETAFTVKLQMRKCYKIDRNSALQIIDLHGICSGRKELQFLRST